MLKKGFTLVEILIVVVIMAILLAIAIPGFRKAHRERTSPGLTEKAIVDQGNGVYLINVEGVLAEKRDIELAKALSLFRNKYPDLSIVLLTPVQSDIGGSADRYILLVEPKVVILEKPDGQ